MGVRRATTLLAATVLVLGLAAALPPIASAGFAVPVAAAAIPHSDVPATDPAVVGGFGAVLPVGLVSNLAVAAHQNAVVKVAGVAGVPSSGVSAVLMTVTVASVSAAGTVVAYPDGSRQPAVADLTFAKGQTVSNLVVTQVGSDGKVRFTNNSGGTVHVTLSISGYFRSGIPALAGAFGAVPAVSVLGSGSGLAVAAHQNAVVKVAGVAGVPSSGVSAVLMTVTVASVSAAGSVVAYADGSVKPGVSDLVFAKGDTVSKLVVARVGADGKVRFTNNSAGIVRVTASVSGYFRSGTPSVAGGFGAVNPVDLRAGMVVAAKQNAVVTVEGIAGVPSSGVSAVLMTVTVASVSAAGSVVAYADGSVKPGVSDLVFAKGETVSNLVVARVGADRKVRLTNNAAGTIRVSVTIRGYYRSDALAPATVTLVNPATGTSAGGNTVDVFGNGFIGVTDVWFGSTRASTFTVNSETDLTVKVPAHVAGVVDVTVTNAGGTSAVSAADRYDYVMPLRWTHTQVRPPQGVITSLSCSSSFCAAVDAFGAAITYRGTAWGDPVIVDPGHYLVSVSCPSASFCLAVDSVGRFLTLKGTVWSSPAQVGGISALTGVSCVSASFCVAVGENKAVTFTASGWATPTAIASAESLSGVSCVSAAFCAATDNDGYLRFYNGLRWAAPTSASPEFLSGVSCATTAFCVAFDTYQVFTWRGGTWTPTALMAQAPDRRLGAVSCPSASFCMAVGALTPFIYDGSSWKAVGGGPGVDYVSCASSSSCVGLTTYGLGYRFNGSAWSGPLSVDSSNDFRALSCASDSFCVATTNGGEVWRFDGTSWTADGRLDRSADGITAVSCPTTDFCVAVGSSGMVYTFDGTTWSGGTLAVAAGTPEVWSLSCRSTTFCVAVTHGTDVVTYNGTAWSAPASVDAGHVLSSVNCPSTKLCIALDESGRALRFNGTTWSAPVTIDPGHRFVLASAISCPSTTLCLALDWEGFAFTFNGTSWSAATVAEYQPDERYGFMAVSCPSSSYCVAFDSSGNQVVFDGRSWSSPTAVGGGRFLSCPSPSVCVAVGLDYAFVGRR